VSADARASPRVAAVFSTDFELLASQRAIFVVAASEGLGVKPDTGRSAKWAPTGAAGLVIGMQLGDKVGAEPLESIPCFLAQVLEHMIERGPRDNLAACAAIVA
jgi:hypothetical protein